MGYDSNECLKCNCHNTPTIFANWCLKCLHRLFKEQGYFDHRKIESLKNEWHWSEGTCDMHSHGHFKGLVISIPTCTYHKRTMASDYDDSDYDHSDYDHSDYDQH